MATNSANTATAAALHSAAIQLLRRLRRTDTATQLPPAQLSALSVLVFVGPQRIGSLAQIEQVTVPTMSRVVQGLATRGMVTRITDPDDQRATLVEPTPKGRRAMEAAQARRLRPLAAYLGSLSARDQAALRRAAELMQRFVDGAEDR